MISVQNDQKGTKMALRWSISYWRGTPLQSQQILCRKLL